LANCDQTRTFSNLVDQDELHLQNMVSSMSNLPTINNHAIATQTLHCSDMLHEDLTCDETRTFSYLVDQDELLLVPHHRSFHTYETSAPRLLHYCRTRRYSHGDDADAQIFTDKDAQIFTQTP
jgi:hypothetical protein